MTDPNNIVQHAIDKIAELAISQPKNSNIPENQTDQQPNFSPDVKAIKWTEHDSQMTEKIVDQIESRISTKIEDLEKKLVDKMEQKISIFGKHFMPKIEKTNFLLAQLDEKVKKIQTENKSLPTDAMVENLGTLKEQVDSLRESVDKLCSRKDENQDCISKLCDLINQNNKKNDPNLVEVQKESENLNAKSKEKSDEKPVTLSSEPAENQLDQFNNKTNSNDEIKYGAPYLPDSNGKLTKPKTNEKTQNIGFPAVDIREIEAAKVKNCTQIESSEKTMSISSSTSEDENFQQKIISKIFGESAFPKDWRQILKKMNDYSEDCYLVFFVILAKAEIESLLSESKKTQNFIEKMYRQIDQFNHDFPNTADHETPWIILDSDQKNKKVPKNLVKLAISVDCDFVKNKISFQFRNFLKEAINVEEPSGFELSHNFTAKNEDNEYFEKWPKNLCNDIEAWKEFESGLKLKKRSRGVIDRNSQNKEQLTGIIRCCWNEFFKCLDIMKENLS